MNIFRNALKPHRPSIFDILLRFHTLTNTFVTDTEKAFLQITINEENKDFLRFLWFDNVYSEQPKIVRNRFAPIIFGVTSSPYLLNLSPTVNKLTRFTKQTASTIYRIITSSIIHTGF